MTPSLKIFPTICCSSCPRTAAYSGDAATGDRICQWSFNRVEGRPAIDLRGDLIRTILLIAAAVVLLGLYLKGKYTQKIILLGGLLVLSSYDLLAVGRRYLNEDSFRRVGGL